MLHLKIGKSVSQRKKKHKSSMIQLIFEKNDESLVCLGFGSIFFFWSDFSFSSKVGNFHFLDTLKSILAFWVGVTSCDDCVALSVVVGLVDKTSGCLGTFFFLGILNDDKLHVDGAFFRILSLILWCLKMTGKKRNILEHILQACIRKKPMKKFKCII